MSRVSYQKPLCLWIVLICLALGCYGRNRSESALLVVQSFRNQNLEAYPDFASLVRSSSTIPGLNANFVPQGIAFIPDTNFVLLSGYQGLTFDREWQAISRWPFVRRSSRVKDKRAIVMLVNHIDGKPVRVGLLKNEYGRPMARHAGGVAVWGDHFWIPGYFKMFRFALSEFLDADPAVVSIQPDIDSIPIDSRGSFVSIFDDTLLVGDFVYAQGYTAPTHHASPLPKTPHSAWTAAYRLHPNTGRPISTNHYGITIGEKSVSILRPDFVLHHRQRVQGIAIRKDDLIALSVSYGDSDSKIATYRIDGLDDPETAPDRTPLPDGSEVPSWTLSELNWTGITLIAPPGSEGVTWNDDVLAIVFEGGAYPYRTRWHDLEDRTLFIQWQ